MANEQNDGRKDGEFAHGGMNEKEKQKARSKGGTQSGGNTQND
jgi:hypothetical protein